MEPPSKKSRLHKQQYREEYSKMWPCIKPSPLGDEYVRCDVCAADVKIASGAKSDIAKHVATAKHKAREGVPSVKSFFTKKSTEEDDLEVIRAEALFTAFLVEHNFPLAAMDHVGKLFKRMFPDSKIAAKWSCARTKTRKIISTLSKASEKAIVASTKDQPFSLLTDGSNDRGSEQLYPIVLRYNNGEKVVSDVLTIASPNGASTGINIYGCLTKELETRQLSWLNCISFGADNASVMLGKINGVAAHLKAANPNIIIQGCSCHLLHLAAKKGANALKIKCEDFLIDLYYYLENSSKRLKALESWQKETGVALKKILKHGPTRWLSLQNCLQRLEENWEPVCLFIQSEMTQQKSKPSSTSRLARLHSFVTNPASPLYMGFLLSALPTFTNANLLLQSEEPVIHLMYQRLIDVATDLMICFLKPSEISKTENLFRIKHDHRSRQLDREDLIIGEKARAHLKKDRSATGLSSTAVTDFFQDARSFYSSSLGYIFDKFPLDSKLLKHAQVINVKERLQHHFSSVRFFMELFKGIFGNIDMTSVQREFAKYQSHALKEVNVDVRIDEVWNAISKLKDSSDTPLFSNLAQIMLAVATIPHSNATSERVFSLVRKNKTEQRSSMSRDLLTDVIRIKCSMMAKDVECHSFVLDKATLVAAKSKTQAL